MLDFNSKYGTVSEATGIGNFRLNNERYTIMFCAYWGSVDHKGKQEIINEEGLYFNISMVFDKASNRSYTSPRFTIKHLPLIREVAHELRLNNKLGKRWM